MRRLVASLAALALAGCAAGPGSGPRNIPLAANPSSLVAAEIGFSRLASERGLWTAFRETMHPDAEMFTPLRVRAADFVKNRADPPQAPRWTPYAVAVSCDGTVGATRGVMTYHEGSQDNFITVWARLPDGSWRWLLDVLDNPSTPLEPTEMISSRTATCTGTPGLPIAAPQEGEDLKIGAAADQTLIWRSLVRVDGSREVVVSAWNGSSFDPVFTSLGRPQ